MITKILFTAAVIVVVMVVFRHKRRAPAPKPLPRAGEQTPQAQGIRPRTLAYVLVAVLISISGGIYWLIWIEQHQVVTIRVIDGASGESVSYQAYKKTIEGRDFETLDGRRVTMGSNDRIELLEAQ